MKIITYEGQYYYQLSGKDIFQPHDLFEFTETSRGYYWVFTGVGKSVAEYNIPDLVGYRLVTTTKKGNKHVY